MEMIGKKALVTAMVVFAMVVATTSTTSTAGLNTPQDEFLRLHNAARAEAGVNPVWWDSPSLEAWALQRAGTCNPVHEPGPYGENIWWGSQGWNWTPADAVAWWVSEGQWYNAGTGTCSAPPGQTCLHYTQVVWPTTAYIGCALVVCNRNNIGTFVVCNYWPPGNTNNNNNNNNDGSSQPVPASYATSIN